MISIFIPFVKDVCGIKNQINYLKNLVTSFIRLVTSNLIR